MLPNALSCRLWTGMTTIFKVCKQCMPFHSRSPLFQATSNKVELRFHKFSSLATCHLQFIGSHRIVHKRLFSRDYGPDDNEVAHDSEITGEELTKIVEDFELASDLGEDYFLPADGQNIFVIQVDEKYNLGKKKSLTTPELKLAEACALVDSLPKWKVVDKTIVRIKRNHKRTLFTDQGLEKLTKSIHQLQHFTAVYVGVDMLSGMQLASLQSIWKVPVYDKYTLVLQIFKLRARTAEAKLQVALAELPYYRSRIVGLHKGTLDQQRGGLASVGGSGEKLLELRHRLLNERAVKIKKALTRLRDKRQRLRKDRQKKSIPLVAVVGYTNAGKTSLIKAVTGEESMKPLNQLFATLDVTVHEGFLPNKLRVLFADTVGFISDIPIELIESFAATLEDIIMADVIVHIRDVSHPDQEAQKVNVIETLSQLNIPDRLSEGIIEVFNKVDLINSAELEAACVASPCVIPVSVKTGEGLTELRKAIETQVIGSTGRLEKRFKVPQSGKHLTWLYREADVKRVTAFPDDPECLLVDAVLTEAAYAKFCTNFRRKQ